MPYSYLASRYTIPEVLAGETATRLMDARIAHIELAVVKLMYQGVHVFSPAVYFRSISRRHTLPTETSFWKNYARSMLEEAKKLYILELDGQTADDHFAYEIRIAGEHKIPIQRIRLSLDLVDLKE